MVKRICVFLSFFFIIFSAVSCTEPYLEIDGTNDEDKGQLVPEEGQLDPYQEIEAWFDLFCSSDLGGRYSGSKGIETAVEYISDIIGRSDSLTVDLFSTDRCPMRNIIYHIDGLIDSLVVLGAHYDTYGYYNSTPLPGADDNMSGTAVLLSFIKGLQRDKIQPRYSIDICFFDGEEIGRYGSNHYLDQCEKGIKLYINVDTCGKLNDGLVVLYNNEYPFLQDVFVLFRPLVRDVDIRISVYNPKGYTTDCEPFQRKCIPFVSIQNSTHSYYLHTTMDDVSHISFEKIDNLARGLDQYIRVSYSVN